MRFETATPIGQGAMGEVARAWDSVLGRPVALKFLRFADPGLRDRMLREARAQARVDHPNVCKVYDVGELDGRPYIAMQFIDGRPLDEAAAGLDLEKKLALLRTVAEAVHAAHGAGLVHRDLKPGNILVESRADGELVPFVLDFGLCREVEAPGLTVSGQLLGTPSYMSPEQARGEALRIDRRSDVFSLGVILFELLTGERPFAGENPMAVLWATLEQEAPRLRTRVAWAPRDLETIVARALEKERDRRYPTARALAEDLGRFLAGEPIAARPVSLAEWLVRRGRRHPWVTGLLAAGALALTIVGGYAMHARRLAALRAETGQRFGREVERIDALLRGHAFLPPHDLRPVRVEVRRRLVDLELRSRELGSAARGLGNFATGRALAALGDLEGALRELEAAWAGDLRTPEVAAELGLARARLYQRALEAVQSSAEPGLRDALLAEARERYRDPAVALLSEVALEADSRSDLVRAWLAVCEEDFPRARGLALRAAEDPLLVEAHRLAAETLRLESRADLVASRYPAARARLAEARVAFADLAQRAHSDPAVQLGRCRLTSLALDLSLSAGDALPENLAVETAACDLALVIDPDAIEPLVERSAAGWRAGRLEIQNGVDPSITLSRAVADAEEALRRSPESNAALSALGSAHLAAAEWEREGGRDPRASLARAIGAFRLGSIDRPGGSELALRHANTLVRLTEDDLRHGRDPARCFAEAATAYERVIALGGPLAGSGYNGRGVLEMTRGEYLQSKGQEAAEALEASRRAFDEAIARSPGSPGPYSNLGLLLWTMANEEQAAGADPSATLASAAEALAHSLALAPGRLAPGVNLIGVRHAQALATLERGGDPRPLVAAGEQAAAAIAERSPYDFHFNRAELAILVARWQVRHETSPEQTLSGATGHARQALALYPEEADCLRLGAEVERWRAGWLARDARQPDRELRASVSRGLALANRAVELNPALATAHAQRAALLFASAALADGTPGAARRLDEARAAWTRALAENPRLRDPIGAELAAVSQVRESPSRL